MFMDGVVVDAQVPAAPHVVTFLHAAPLLAGMPCETAIEHVQVRKGMERPGMPTFERLMASLPALLIRHMSKGFQECKQLQSCCSQTAHASLRAGTNV